MGSDKGYYFGVVRAFWKKYFVVGYVLEAPQNNSEKLFWGVTLVILPRVARIESPWETATEKTIGANSQGRRKSTHR